MKHYLLSAAAIAMLCSVSAAHAESSKDGAGYGHGEKGMKYEAPKSRGEAIERTKEHLQRLEGMSDAEWQERKEKRTERREKWKEASPEERQEMKEKLKDKREKKQSGEGL